MSQYDYGIYCPWKESSFRSFYDSISARTLVSSDRVYTLWKLASNCMILDGSFAECGVYKGGTAKVLAKVIENEVYQRKSLHLFDTFEGMPDIADLDPAPEKKGYYSDTSLEIVRDYLAEYGFITMHPGIIPSTFESIKWDFAFVHIDVDLYSTTMDCCEFFYGRMVRGGIILFDDYGFERYELAAKKAIDEFFVEKTEDPIVLKTGQAFIIKR